MKDFPRLSVRTGRYAAEWFIDGRVIPGELELESGRPPRLIFFEEAKPIIWRNEGKSRSAGFPQDHQLPQIVGKLRTGQDVVVTDALVSVWLPERSSGFGRYAVVGLGIADVAASGYTRVRLQVTGADLLFGSPPIKSVSFPDPSLGGFEGKFSAELNPASGQRWEDPSTGLVIDCSYEGSFSLTNTYRHELTFAPVIEFTGNPKSVDEWMTQWVGPFLGLAALATRGPQRLSWLTVHANQAEQERAHATSSLGVLFGSGIDQAPYQAEYLEEWRDPDRRALFTLKDLPAGLPIILSRWRTLEAGQNPFVDLYRSVLVQTDLPARARFLYLVQALEGLHAFENRSGDETEQAKFEAQRHSALSEVASAGVAHGTVKFIKDHWSRRRPDSLDRRVGDLLEGIPSAIRNDLESPDIAGLVPELKQEGAGTLEAQIRVLRNQLSHGSRDFEEHDLKPWVRVVEVMCRAHVMRLLGFDAAGIERSLTPR